MQECKCDFRTKAVGDGCEVCNPAKALECAKETIAELEQRIKELEAGQGEPVAFADEIIRDICEMEMSEQCA